MVDKKGTTEKRLAVDFKKLNHHVRRPTHPTHSPRDVLSKISNTEYFTKMDARHGYWQVTLSDSATCNIYDARGKIRFLRNPQDLISVGDEFHPRNDEAFQRINNMSKIVDDCLAYDDDFDTNVHRMRENVFLHVPENAELPLVQKSLSFDFEGLKLRWTLAVLLFAKKAGQWMRTRLPQPKSFTSQHVD